MVYERKPASIGLFVGLLCLIGLSALRNPQPPARGQSSRFYDIDLCVEERGIADLKGDPRAIVPCSLAIGTYGRFPGYLHLKGNSTFAPIDSRPSFSIRVAGNPEPLNSTIFQQKFYLHNSAQDVSLLSDVVARNIYDQCGLPVGDLAFAAVTLNGRFLGNYVVAEGVGKSFLNRRFGSGKWNLLEGDGSETCDLFLRSRQAAHAAESGRSNRRLDVPSVRAMIAAEYLTANTDGFVFCLNNYWLFQRQGDPTWRVFPHTADRILYGNGHILRLTPSPAEAIKLLEDESQRALVLATMRSQLSPDALRRRFEAFDVVSSNLLRQIAIRTPNELKDRCASMTRLKAALIRQSEDLLSTLEIESGTKDFTSDFRSPLMWRSAVSAPLNLVDYSRSRGKVLYLSSKGGLGHTTLECPIILRPGCYSLKVPLRFEGRDNAEHPPAVSVAIGGLASTSGTLARGWNLSDLTFATNQRFDGRLFHVESTKLRIVLTRLEGDVSFDLDKIQLHRLRE